LRGLISTVFATLSSEVGFKSRLSIFENGRTTVRAKSEEVFLSFKINMKIFVTDAED
jgi:hypothetical protein